MTEGLAAYPDRRPRPSHLICVMLVLVLPIVAHTDKREPADVYDKQKNPETSKLSTHRQDDESMGKSNRVHGDVQSFKTNERNSVALNRFLENVLRARNDFKWIDQAVREANRANDWQKSPSELPRVAGSSMPVNLRRGNKLREKRAYDQKFRADEDDRVSNGATTLRRNADFDPFQNGISGSALKGKVAGPMDDRVPKDWTKTEDICSLSDWLNSSKEPGIDEEKLKDRWIREYESDPRNPRQGSKDKPKDQRKESASLESLKETVLQLKKSLNEADKKVRDTAKNVEVGKAREGPDERRTRGKNKHETGEDDDGADSECSGPATFDLRKRDQTAPGDPDDKNARLKVRRTKRTEVNNGDGNPKLFHRAGFGAPYLEQEALKELHDRKRRSKGAPSYEKRYLNEAPDKNNVMAEQRNSIEISGEAGCNGDSDSDGRDSSPNDSRGRKTSNNLDDRSKYASNSEKGETGDSKTGKHYELSDLTRRDSNRLENRLRNDGRGEDLEGNSLRTSGTASSNELQPASAETSAGPNTDDKEEVLGVARTHKTEENRENAGSAEGEQAIKVVEPQGRLYENSERTKGVRRIEPDDNQNGKLSQKPAAEKKESGNINILLKSENKDMIQFSDARCSTRNEQPFVLNALDVRKKLVMENEGQPIKTVSTVYNVKIEESGSDTAPKPDQKQEKVPKLEDKSELIDGASIFGSERSKPDEGTFKDTFTLMTEAKGGKNDEKQLKNEVSGKESTANADKEDSRVFYDALSGNRTNINADESLAEKGNAKAKMAKGEERADEDKKEILKGDNPLSSEPAASSADTSPSAVNSDLKPYEESKKKNYHEIVIVSDGMADAKLNDAYGQRRILQYMEYSNDDVENAELNYSDKEEEDKQQAGDTESGITVQRKQRSALNDKGKAKVNVMIQEKLNQKKKKTKRESVRKRRDPIKFIAYYDYDDDVEQQVRDTSGEQERVKTNSEQNAIESNMGLEADEPPDKDDQQEKEMQKQRERKEKLKYKVPVQYYIPDEEELQNITYTTVNPKLSDSSFNFESPEMNGPSSKRQPDRLDQGEDNVNSIDRERLNQRHDDKEMRSSNDATGQTIVKPMNYIITVDERVVPESVDDVFNDFQFIDQKNDKISNDVKPLYEELKTVYDWSDDEVKIKPRVKGDQRLHCETTDTADPTMNVIAESSANQIENPKLYSRDKVSDSSPNLLPLLLVHGGSGGKETAEKSYLVESSEQLETPVAGNVSRSNYFALKSTDDMFKGGPEQANSTEEKLRGPSGIGAGGAGGVGGGESRVQKVNGGRNDAFPEKDAAGRSLTGREQYIDTDSRSPYENRKYLVPPAASMPREHVQNLDQEKQTVISSRDLHESFVESSEWIDDFDNDVVVRLSRGLKTVERLNSNSNLTRNGGSLNTMLGEGPMDASSPEIVRTKGGSLKAILKPETSELGFIVNPASDLHGSRKEDNARVRREALSRYETFYDDANEHLRNFESMDYNRYPENTANIDNRIQLSSSHENVDNPNGISSSNTDVGNDYSENLSDYDYYTKVVRSAKKAVKHKKKKKKKKHKKKKKKSKSKYSEGSRKRRHRKKHSNESKTKDHDRKKQKKRVSKTVNHHANVKESRTDQSGEKVHEHNHRQPLNERKRHRKEMGGHDNANDPQRRIVSLLLAADNVEDESQMDSALRGELPGKIVEQIYTQVQKNENLKASLGPGLNRNHKTDDAIAKNKRYRQALDDNETKHTKELMEKVMLLLNRLVFDEVERKTCVSLPPDLVEFLGWMLEVNPGETPQEQLPSLPMVHSMEPIEHFPREKLLFQANRVQAEGDNDVVEMHKKLRLIESLIKEYKTLSEAEKSKVQSVHDYLGKQLDSMLEYVEAKQEIETKGKSSFSSQGDSENAERILRHQTGIRNATIGDDFTGTARFSSGMSITDTLKVGNKGFLRDRNDFRDRRRVVRSVDKHPKRRKKHRAKGKRERKHGKRHKGASTIDQTRHKDAAHKAASRQKRDYLDKDFWASFHSGYETPLIYNSMDMINAEPKSDELERIPSSGAENGEKTKCSEDVLVKELKEIGEQQKTELTDAKSEMETATMRSSSTSTGQDLTVTEEEPITGKNQVEDEILLLNKRQSWKKVNEQQLEEVAFGEDMRKGLEEKELFEKLTEIDKERSALESSEKNNRKDNGSSISLSANEANDLWGKHAQDYGLKDSNTYLSDEDKLRKVEEKINVYSDNDHDAQRKQETRGER